ncbi:N-succinyldiaminopimelate aminotransferase [Ardenticatena maritima]|uniref:Aminotransferase n=1 Tax=Ardenticatena maritima TaxID=872965 RepID=A0A0M8K8Y1_9CHLR|nr:methionine aminotransferase [Ardenticatena maritima]KPL88600.1 aminotransferase [Ardenticatena maritima]GAP63162.1 N-succinyldiaminopimelate aminotransferase [Ardenticatena maritima]
MNEHYLATRIHGMGTTIFTEMSALAAQYGAVNLGQAFPDFAGFDVAKEAARTAIANDLNQYAPMTGQPALRQALAEHAARFYNMTIDPQAHITITAGATEAIFATLLGLVNPGDEVVLFEPFYDSYRPAVEMAGGNVRVVTLRPPTFAPDPDELRAAFSARTKAIVVNTPHNPTGHVFTEEELRLIAELCQEHDVVAITDEVYEHIVFEGHRHVRLATLPGMWERTITISSAGKTFSLTGWKIGWAIAPEHLTAAVRRTHQFITFAVATPLQEGIAAALREAEARGYYAHLVADYTARRDFLCTVLREAGLRVFEPQGTYFVLTDITPLGFDDDVAFCRFLTTEIGVAAIPPSAFYVNKEEGRRLARFTFCKTWQTLEAAAERLRKLRERV